MTNPQLTWLISILGMPQIDSAQISTIDRLAEKRNAYVHYKWTSMPIDSLKHRDQEFRKLIDNVEEAVIYLQNYGLSQRIDVPLETIEPFV